MVLMLLEQTLLTFSGIVVYALGDLIIFSFGATMFCKHLLKPKTSSYLRITDILFTRL
jgi:hypothetical protein